MTTAHILVVDVDPTVRTLLRRGLEGKFCRIWGEGLREMQACLNRQSVSLITLTSFLVPKMAWIWLATFARIAAFRSLCRPVKVILSIGLLISRWAPTATQVKSFQLCELLARIRAVVRGSRHPGRVRQSGSGMRLRLGFWISAGAV
jgi:DNA-binding response OmpR family regulator